MGSEDGLEETNISFYIVLSVACSMKSEGAFRVTEPSPIEPSREDSANMSHARGQIAVNVFREQVVMVGH